MDDKMYVIKNNETGKWIAVDKASGGHPYDTDIQRAEIFYSKKRAQDYRNVMKADWSLYRLEMHGIPERWENEA